MARNGFLKQVVLSSAVCFIFVGCIWSRSLLAFAETEGSFCTVESSQLFDEAIGRRIGKKHQLLQDDQIPVPIPVPKADIEKEQLSKRIKGHFRNVHEDNLAVATKAPKGSALFIFSCVGNTLQLIQRINFPFRDWFLLGKQKNELEKEKIEDLVVVFAIDSEDGGRVKWNKNRHKFEFYYLGYSY